MGKGSRLEASKDFTNTETISYPIAPAIPIPATHPSTLKQAPVL